MTDEPSWNTTGWNGPGSQLVVRQGAQVIPFSKLQVNNVARALTPQLNPTTVRTVVSQGVNDQLVNMSGLGCDQPDGDEYGFIVGYDTSATTDDYGIQIEGGPAPGDNTRTIDTTPGNSVTLGRLAPKNTKLPYLSDAYAGAGMKRQQYGTYPYQGQAPTGHPDKRVKKHAFSVATGKGLHINGLTSADPSLSPDGQGNVEVLLGQGLQFASAAQTYVPGQLLPTSPDVPITLKLVQPQSGLTLSDQGLSTSPDMTTIGFDGNNNLTALTGPGAPLGKLVQQYGPGAGIEFCDTSGTSSGSDAPGTLPDGTPIDTTGPTVAPAVSLSQGTGLTTGTYHWTVAYVRGGIVSDLSPATVIQVTSGAAQASIDYPVPEPGVDSTILYRSKADGTGAYEVPGWVGTPVIVTGFVDDTPDSALGAAYGGLGSTGSASSSGGSGKKYVTVELASFSGSVEAGLCTGGGDDGKGLMINLASVSGGASKALLSMPLGAFDRYVPRQFKDAFIAGATAHREGAGEAPFQVGTPHRIWWHAGYQTAESGLYGAIVQGGGGAGGTGGTTTGGTGTTVSSSGSGSGCPPVPCDNNLTGGGLTIIAGNGNQLSLYLAKGGSISGSGIAGHPGGTSGTGDVCDTGNALMFGGADGEGIMIDLAVAGGFNVSGLCSDGGDDQNGLIIDTDNTTTEINAKGKVQAIGLAAAGQPGVGGNPSPTPSGGTPPPSTYGGPGSTLNNGGNPGQIPPVPPTGSSSGYMPGGACANPTAVWTTPTGDWNFMAVQDLNSITTASPGIMQVDVSRFPDGWTLNGARVHDSTAAGVKVGAQQFPNLPSNVQGWFVMMHFEKGPNEIYDWFGFTSYGSGNGGYQGDGWATDTCGLYYDVASDTWHILGNNSTDKGTTSVQPGGSANLALYVDCNNVPHFFLGAPGGNLTDVTHDVTSVGTVVAGSFSHQTLFGGTANIRYFGATVSGFKAAVGLPSTLTINNFNGSGTTYQAGNPPTPSNIPAADSAAWQQGYTDFRTNPTATAPPTCPYGPNTFSDLCKAYAMGWWDAFNAYHAGDTTTPPQPANGSGGSTIGTTPTPPAPSDVPTQYAANWQQGYADHLNGGAAACPTGVTGDACTYYIEGWQAATGQGGSVYTTNPPAPGYLSPTDQTAWSAGYSAFINKQPITCPSTYTAEQCSSYQQGWQAASSTQINQTTGTTPTSGTPGVVEPGTGTSTGTMPGTPIQQCPSVVVDQTSFMKNSTYATVLPQNGLPVTINYYGGMMVVCGNPPIPIDPSTCQPCVKWRPDLNAQYFQRSNGSMMDASSIVSYPNCGSTGTVTGTGSTVTSYPTGTGTSGGTGNTSAGQTSQILDIFYDPSQHVVNGNPPLPVDPATCLATTFTVPTSTDPTIFHTTAGANYSATNKVTYPSGCTLGGPVSAATGAVAYVDSAGQTWYRYRFTVTTISSPTTGGTTGGTTTSGSGGSTTGSYPGAGGGSGAGLPITGDLTVSGNASVTGNVVVGGNIVLGGTLTDAAGVPLIKPSGYLGGDLEVTGDELVDGNLTLQAVQPPVAGPTVAAQAGSGLAVGYFDYVYTHVTSAGETTASPAVRLTTTAGNQQGKITLPAAPLSVKSRNIYRSHVNTAGTYYLLGNMTGSVAAFTIDTDADSSLGTQQPPTANTTGGKLYGIASQHGDLIIGGADLGLIPLHPAADGTILSLVGGLPSWVAATTPAGALPVGGAVHQVLIKASSTDYDAVWGLISDADVADVASSKITGSIPASWLGTSSTTAAAGNDTRLSNARVPLAHEATHIAGGSDALAGITVAQLSSGAATSGYVPKADGAGGVAWAAETGGGSGTVTSITVTVPSILTITGSPITTSGTFALDLATQAANVVLAGPASGANAAPTFRALTAADMPIATTGAVGAVKPDGTTITINGAGVISSSAGSGATVATTAALGTVEVDNNGGGSPVAITKAGLLVAAPVDSLSSLVKMGDGAYDGGANSFIGNANGTFLGINAATTLPYPTAVLADTPIVYFRLNDATATMVDASGNGYNGSYTGTYTLQSPGATNDSSGSVYGLGKVAQVAGISSHLPSGNAVRTVECIIKMPNGDSNADGAYIDYGSDATNQDFYISHSGNGVNLNVGVGAGREHTFQGGASLSNGAWHHLAVTYDGTTMTAYHNGSAVGTWVPGALNTVPSTIYLGGDAGNHILNNHQNCYTDEVAIYGTALSSARILAHYNAISQAAGTYAGDWLSFEFGGIPIVKIAGNGDITAGKFNGIVPGAGTVSSVAMTVPSILTITGSPIANSGTLALALATQAPNVVFAGPISGANAIPTMRSLVAADLPLATTGAFGAVKPDGTSITISAGVISSSGGGGGSGTGASVNKVQLDYAATTDIASGVSLAATTWTDLGTNQTFTVDDGQSEVEITVGGLVQAGELNTGPIIAQVVVDSAGTPVTKRLGGGLNEVSGSYVNPLSAAPVITLTGLAAGSHTVKVQVYSFFSNKLYCRPGTTPYESLSIRVIERKVVPTGLTSTSGYAQTGTNTASLALTSSPYTGYLTFATATGSKSSWFRTTGNTGFTVDAAGLYRLTLVSNGSYLSSGAQVQLGAMVNGTGRATATFYRDGNGTSNDVRSIDLVLASGDGVEIQAVAIANTFTIPSGVISAYLERVDGQMMNPMILLGDTMYGGAGGLPTRLAPPSGLTGPVLGWDTTNTIPKWQNGSMYPIQDVIVGSGGVASVTFSSIPTGFTHLVIVCRDRSDTASTFAWRWIRFNGDSASNYNSTLGQMDTASTNIVDNGPIGQGYAGMMAAANSDSGAAGLGIIDVPDYARSVWEKAWLADGMTRMSTVGGDMRRESAWGQWQNTAAITSITILPSAGNIVQNSRYTLYGY